MEKFINGKPVKPPEMPQTSRGYDSFLARTHKIARLPVSAPTSARSTRFRKSPTTNAFSRSKRRKYLGQKMKRFSLGIVVAVAIVLIGSVIYSLASIPIAYESLLGWFSVANVLSVSTISLIITLIFNVRAVQADTRTKKMQAFNALLKQWDSSKEAQEYVLTKFEYPGKNLEEDKIDRVLSVCNRIGFMVNLGLISEKDTAEFIGFKMLQLWEKLSKYVYEEGRKVSSFSWIHYEDFVENRLKKKYWKYENGQFVYKKKPKTGFSKEKLREMHARAQ
jgi:uncharacterized membrane protein